MQIETERLLMRPFTREEIIQNEFDWFLDPDVMGSTLGGVDNRARLEHRLKRYVEHQEKFAVSKWLIIFKPLNLPIGDAGLIKNEETDNCFDLGYRLAKEFWGRGLGQEAVGAWIEYSKKLKHTALVAHVEVGNVKSERLLLLNKFSKLGEVCLFGKSVMRYRLAISETVSSDGIL